MFIINEEAFVKLWNRDCRVAEQVVRLEGQNEVRRVVSEPTRFPCTYRFIGGEDDSVVEEVPPSWRMIGRPSRGHEEREPSRRRRQIEEGP